MSQFATNTNSLIIVIWTIITLLYSFLLYNATTNLRIVIYFLSLWSSFIHLLIQYANSTKFTIFQFFTIKVWILPWPGSCSIPTGPWESGEIMKSGEPHSCARSILTSTHWTQWWKERKKLSPTICSAEGPGWAFTILISRPSVNRIRANIKV